MKPKKVILRKQNQKWELFGFWILLKQKVWCVLNRQQPQNPNNTHKYTQIHTYTIYLYLLCNYVCIQHTIVRENFWLDILKRIVKQSITQNHIITIIIKHNHHPHPQHSLIVIYQIQKKNEGTHQKLYGKKVMKKRLKLNNFFFCFSKLLFP